jgi:hypothetical protein
MLSGKGLSSACSVPHPGSQGLGRWEAAACHHAFAGDILRAASCLAERGGPLAIASAKALAKAGLLNLSAGIDVSARSLSGERVESSSSNVETNPSALLTRSRWGGENAAAYRTGRIGYAKISKECAVSALTEYLDQLTVGHGHSEDADDDDVKFRGHANAPPSLASDENFSRDAFVAAAHYFPPGSSTSWDMGGVSQQLELPHGSGRILYTRDELLRLREVLTWPRIDEIPEAIRSVIRSNPVRGITNRASSLTSTSSIVSSGEVSSQDATSGFGPSFGLVTLATPLLKLPNQEGEPPKRKTYSRTEMMTMAQIASDSSSREEVDSRFSIELRRSFPGVFVMRP